ncbi:MAG TPA: hypothetical protein VK589_06165 [Chryseolinea sp.]|nr:hypothetical protein [Chryseolinea sp.]
MSVLQTHFPKIAVNVAKGNSKAAVERMKIPLNTAISNLNVIINKMEMRESMSVDEHINIGAARNLLIQIEAEMDVVKNLLSDE